jgi:hypothetical protein
MRRFHTHEVLCLVAAATVVSLFGADVAVPESRTLKRTSIELGDENPAVIKIGETKAIKIGESSATKIGESPTDKIRRIDVGTDIKAMHEKTFGPLGENRLVLTNAVQEAMSAGPATAQAPAVPLAPAPIPVKSEPALPAKTYATTNKAIIAFAERVPGSAIVVVHKDESRGIDVVSGSDSTPAATNAQPAANVEVVDEQAGNKPAMDSTPPDPKSAEGDRQTKSATVPK